MSQAIQVTALALVLGCNSGGGLGAVCAEHSNCQDQYQCLQLECVPRCARSQECGDGYRCDDGQCTLVNSMIGDPCKSEVECGPGHNCILGTTLDSENFVQATCQSKGRGGNVGSLCQADNECLNQVCALGHCSQLCNEPSDCPNETTCAIIPRLVDSADVSGNALFRGCLQRSGVLRHDIPIQESFAEIELPVPDNARSVSIVTQIDDDVHIVGPLTVVSPAGDILFNGINSANLLVNKIRYIRRRQVSTLMFPNTDSLNLQTGFYKIQVEATLPPFGAGSAVPKVTVLYKMDEASLLDLHFHFLNLDSHPCAERIGEEVLTAATARELSGFQNEYLPELGRIIAAADLRLGTISYNDIRRADLDGITNETQLRDLFRLADNDRGIAVFVVRSLPDGVQASGGSIPGAPLPGTSTSGIVISADTLCYRSWATFARITSHMLAGHMGLWNNRDGLNIPDPISDTTGSSDNLMFFGEFGGTKLTEGQKRVLLRFPGLR